MTKKITRIPVPADSASVEDKKSWLRNNFGKWLAEDFLDVAENNKKMPTALKDFLTGELEVTVPVFIKKDDGSKEKYENYKWYKLNIKNFSTCENGYSDTSINYHPELNEAIIDIDTKKQRSIEDWHIKMDSAIFIAVANGEIDFLKAFLTNGCQGHFPNDCTLLQYSHNKDENFIYNLIECAIKNDKIEVLDLFLQNESLLRGIDSHIYDRHGFANLIIEHAEKHSNAINHLVNNPTVQNLVATAYNQDSSIKSKIDSLSLQIREPVIQEKIASSEVKK